MVHHSIGTVLVRHLRHVRRRDRARRASQRQGGGGINGKSQDRRPVCQNAGDPQAWNSRGQASKIKVVSTSLSEKAQAWRMRKLAPTKSYSCGAQDGLCHAVANVDLLENWNQSSRVCRGQRRAQEQRRHCWNTENPIRGDAGEGSRDDDADRGKRHASRR